MFHVLKIMIKTKSCLLKFSSDCDILKCVYMVLYCVILVNVDVTSFRFM